MFEITARSCALASPRVAEYTQAALGGPTPDTLTRRHRWRAALALALLAVVALLAGCGGGGGGSASTLQAPTLLIRSDATGEVRGPFKVQFFFSAPVSFGSGTLAFSLSGASVVPNSFQPLNADTWQVTLTPDANKQGLVDLRVPAGAFTDPANGLSNTAAVEFAQPYNTLAPFAELKFGGPVNALGMITGPGSFTLSFGAALDAPMTADKVDLSAGAIGQFTKTSAAGQKDVYTFVFTPPPATLGSVTFEMRKGAVTAGGIPNDRNWWTFGLATP